MIQKQIFPFLFSLTCLTGLAQNTATLSIEGANPKVTISRHIYGHFSEHLGRCIYDGFWVGDSIKVPKKDRIRLDVVEALK
jgi:alpha-N-arabinofuranosidase